MGGSTWSSDAYSSLKSSYAGKSKSSTFKSSGLAKELDPHGIKFREARDSSAHPESLAIQVWLDETGSMGDIPYKLATQKLGDLMDTLIKHGIKHPAILFGGIGDHYSDSSPLQVGQFESGTKELDECLTKIFLEGCGGGQNMESYLMAWLIAGRHTSIDCYEKRGIKGFLFTVGDEANHGTFEAEKLKDILGYKQAQDVTDEQLLEEAKRMYHVFHIHINEASHRDDSYVLGYWKKMLGERCIVLDDYNALAEVIASTVAIMHGIDLKTVTKGFNKGIAATVTKSLSNIKTVATTTKKAGAVKL